MLYPNAKEKREEKQRRKHSSSTTIREKAEVKKERKKKPVEKFSRRYFNFGIDGMAIYEENLVCGTYNLYRETYVCSTHSEHTCITARIRNVDSSS